MADAIDSFDAALRAGHRYGEAIAALADRVMDDQTKAVDLKSAADVAIDAAKALMQEAAAAGITTDAENTPAADAAETPPIAEVEFVCQARVPGGVCGATARHATNTNMCSAGHFIAGNQAAFRHGARAFERHGDAVLPPDVRMTADDMFKGIIADKGGANNLTTLKREYAQRARDFRVMLDLILHYLVRRGLTTERGRVRSAVTKYLEIFDRFDKCAQRLGLEREPREAMLLAARLAVAPPLTAETEDHDAGD